MPARGECKREDAKERMKRKGCEREDVKERMQKKGSKRKDFQERSKGEDAKERMKMKGCNRQVSKEQIRRKCCEGENAKEGTALTHVLSNHTLDRSKSQARMQRTTPPQCRREVSSNHRFNDRDRHTILTRGIAVSKTETDMLQTKKL